MQRADYAANAALAGTTVLITRGWGGTRATVPLETLRGWHIAIAEGGLRRRLPHPMLAAYVTDCGVLPAEFDHDCKHGPRPTPRRSSSPAPATTAPCTRISGS